MDPHYPNGKNDVLRPALIQRIVHPCSPLDITRELAGTEKCFYLKLVETEWMDSKWAKLDSRIGSLRGCFFTPTASAAKQRALLHLRCRSENRSSGFTARVPEMLIELGFALRIFDPWFSAN